MVSNFVITLFKFLPQIMIFRSITYNLIHVSYLYFIITLEN